MRILPFLLFLSACDSGPVLIDEDAGRDAGSTPDAGTGDAGSPDVDAGPECLHRDPVAPSDPSSGSWTDRFANPGVGGDLPNVNAFAFGADGEVYIGGEFTTAGYTPASNIASWNGGDGWRAIGGGLPGRVRSIAVRGEEIWAAHAVTDYFATRISRWDGTAWSTIADAENGSIEEIVFAGTTLIVAGSFTRIGGSDIAGLARFDGAWSGYGITPDGSIEAISAISADDLCVGGAFYTLGVIEARYAACFDGTWQARSMPIDFYRGVFDLARDPAGGALVAGGDFMLDESGANGGSIARWNGSAWELIGGGVTSEFGPGSTKEVRGIAFAPSGLYLGGAFGGFMRAGEMVPVNAAARWDGSAWHDLGGLFKEVGFSLDTTNVFTVAAGPDGSVYFGGLFTRAGSARVAHVVRWDGTYWSALRTPGERYDGVGGSVLALAREGSCAVYVGGEFEYAGEVRANNIARFTREDGYEALGAGVIGAVTDVRALPDGRVLIGGAFVDAETGTRFANVARWDGAAWEGFGVAPEGMVWAVEADPAESPDEADIVYAGGNFVSAGDVEARGVAVWDGTAWSELGGGVEGFAYEWDPTMRAPGYPYDLLVLEDGDVIVAGTFQNAGGVEVNNIARWDGEAWHAYGGGLGDAFGVVHSVAMWNGRLVASGSFDERVAVWNGTAWEALGSPLAGFTVAAIDAAGEALIAGGMFSLVEGGPYAHVAVFVDGEWRDLDAGVSDIVEAVMAMDEGIYFGGTFDRAGASPAVGLALFSYE